MVFGADGCKTTHWKNLSDENKDELLQSFRQGLYKKTDLSPEKWKSYWKDMIEFHNKYTAHCELNFPKPVPNFATALKIAYYYDKWIREVISPDFFEEPALQETAEQLKKIVTPLIKQLLEKT